MVMVMNPKPTRSPYLWSVPTAPVRSSIMFPTTWPPTTTAKLTMVARHRWFGVPLQAMIAPSPEPECASCYVDQVGLLAGSTRVKFAASVQLPKLACDAPEGVCPAI